MFNSRAKTLAKIEKTLLKAKNRNPISFDVDNDCFIVTDISSNTKSKIEEKDDHLISEESHIVVDALDAMTLIGRNEYYELIPYLYDFLQDPDKYLREKAIVTFGDFYAEQLSGLEEKLLEIWSNEKEEYEVRTAAIGVWGGFYRNTYDKYILKKMYQLLRAKNVEIYFRFSAFAIILDVVGDRLNVFEDLGLYNEVIKLENMDDGSYDEDAFNAAIDWDRINNIMKKHAPEALQIG